MAQYMTPSFAYENSNGDYISFSEYPYLLLSMTDIFDYAYDYELSVRGKAKNLIPKITPKSLTIAIKGKNDTEFALNKVRLLELIDVDSFQSKEGTLWCGSYSLKGVFVASKKPTKYVNVPMTTVQLTFYPNSGSWLSHDYYYFGETTVGYRPYLDYNYDYAYDYAVDNVTGSLENKSYLPSKFKFEIYGPAINPTITIGQWNYGIQGTLEDNEMLIIDSLNNEIYKIYMDTGARDNMFANRFRNFFAFQPIPSGINIVAWNGLFSFIVELYGERREPKWAEGEGPTPPEPPTVQS